MMLILTIYLAQRYSPEKLGMYARAVRGKSFQKSSSTWDWVSFFCSGSPLTGKSGGGTVAFLPLRMVLSLLSFVSLVIMALLLNKNAETLRQSCGGPSLFAPLPRRISVGNF
jgi:hypothetical protein